MQLDKAQLAEQARLDKESRERGERRVLIVTNGKRHWGWL